MADVPFRCLQQIRHHKRQRQKSDLPVIFLTSKDDEIDELFGLKMGADDFITKPFSNDDLIARIRRHLGVAGGPERAADSAASETCS